MKYKIDLNRKKDSQHSKILCLNEENKKLSHAIVSDLNFEEFVNDINDLINKEIEYLEQEYDIKDIFKLKEKYKLQFGTFIGKEYDEYNLEILYNLKTNIIDNKNLFSKGLSVLFLEAFEEKTRAGTFIVDYLKDIYDYIILYSDCEAIEYWEKQSFIEFFDGYYFWSKNTQIINLLKSQ